MHGEELHSFIQSPRRGDGREFEELIGPLIEPGYRLAFTMVGDRAEAEDVVQESALRAWTKLAQLRDRASIRAWFLSIVANQARMTLRGRWASVIKLAEVERADGASEDRLAQSMDLKRALAALPEDDRTVLFLYFSLDLTFDEVGEILGITAAGAKSRIYRAVRKLRPDLSAGES